MDLPGPASLRQLRLSVSAEGRGFAYYIADRTNGKILSISRSAAQAFMLFEDVVAGNASSREKLSEEQAREGLRAVTYLRSVRDHERLRGIKINPMSMQFKFFDVGQYQPALRPFANWFIGWPIIAVFAVLSLLAFFIGTQNNWAVRVEFQDVLNVEALLTFGLIAPFLKIIHELGHVLVATRFGVQVRKAGVNLIGLYPLPYVDCTEADLTARRRDRIWISLAGLFTDFFIGLIAFMVWHLADSDAVQGVAGRVLAFSTLNSLLFNVNPLMKFDGYYAFVDLIGQRNLYSRATKTFTDFRRYVATFGAVGALPRGREGWLVLGYGFATFGYRILVLYTIMTLMMPQYLGFGMMLTAWGAYAMFLSPLMADQRQGTRKREVKSVRNWLNRVLFLMVFTMVLVFVKLPFVRVIDLQLDQIGHYGVSVQSEGVVQVMPTQGGFIEAGETLVRLSNPRFAEQSAILALEKAEAELLVSTTAGISAAQTQAGEDKLASVVLREETLARDIRNLFIPAPVDGLFVPVLGDLRVGHFLTSGSSIGSFYPNYGSARLIGSFPERMAETYQTADIQMEIWDEENYAPIPETAVRLVEAVNIDARSGSRNFQLETQFDRAPSTLVGRDLQLKLDFGARPILEHIHFWIDGQIAAFRDAQLADQAKRLDDP